MTREEAILNAWNKIRKYVKENYNGVFEKGTQFRWKHECYYWIEFGVTKDGDAYFVRGSHGWGGDYFYCPFKNEPSIYPHIKLAYLNDVVEDWQSIKKVLQSLAKKENELYNFEV